MILVETLPLVEFELEAGITDTEAVRLIETPKSDKPENADGWVQEVSDSHQTLQLGEGEDDKDVEDVFTEHLLNFEVNTIRFTLLVNVYTYFLLFRVETGNIFH